MLLTIVRQEEQLNILSAEKFVALSLFGGVKGTDDQKSKSYNLNDNPNDNERRNDRKKERRESKS